MMVRSALARRVNLLGGSDPQVVTTVDRWVLLVGLGLSAVVLGFLVVTLVRARRPATLTSYALTYEALALVNQALAVRPRFVFTAFPFVIALATSFRDRRFINLIAVLAGGMVLLFFFYTLPYLQGRYIVAP